MSKARIWLAVLVLTAGAVSIGAIVIWWQTRPPWSVTGLSFTDDMTPVELYVQNARGAGVRLRIPASYMQWGFNRRGGLTPKIALIAVYPEMTPYGALSSQEKWRYINGDWDDDKSLRFDPLIHVQASIPEFLERIFADKTDPKRLISVSQEEQFVRYKITFASAVREYLVPHDADLSAAVEGQKGPLFECLPLPAAVKVEDSQINCQGSILLGDRLLIDYSVPRRRIAEWRRVEEGVRALIDSFIVDCFESEQLKEGEETTAFHGCNI
jgi:hypothetical protein